MKRKRRSVSARAWDWMEEMQVQRDAEMRQRLWYSFAAAALAGMLGSAPMCDRTKIDKAKWCRIAGDWADVMLSECERRLVRRKGGKR